jgi:hypothetical protein
MKKIRLALDALEVESFDVADSLADRGTVHGCGTGVDDPCQPSRFGECMVSYEAHCWWTGDPMRDCYAPSELNDCTDYRC